MIVEKPPAAVDKEEGEEDLARCAACGNVIRMDETLVEHEGKDYHLDCEPLDDDEAGED